MKFKPSSPVFRLREGIQVEYFDDGALICDLKDRHFHEVNCTARDILRLMDGRRNIEQIAQLIADKYEMPYAEVRLDVMEFFEQFAEQGIVKRSRRRARGGSR